MQFLNHISFRLRYFHGHVCEPSQFPSIFTGKPYNLDIKSSCNHRGIHHICTVTGCRYSKKYISRSSITKQLLSKNSIPINIIDISCR